MAKGHHYIETRLRDLLAAARLATPWPPDQHARFEEVVRLIAAIFHYDTFAALGRLKDLYDPLDPDREALSSASGAGAGAFAAFEHELEPILNTANFEETGFDALGPRARASVLGDLRVKASDAGIRTIRFFSRGGHMKTIVQREWFGLRRKVVETEMLDDVVLIVAFRDQSEIKPDDRRALARMRRGVRPGAALVKLFTGVARNELIALHPGATPAMRTQDQLFLGVPALAGGVPLALQIVPAFSVLFALIAAYFGASAVIDDSALKRAIAAISGVAAVGGFLMRQWMKYQRQSLIYQKRLADTVYYRNLANNHGVIATLISAAEEQDVKEAALAYWALLAAGAPMSKNAIDEAVEKFLRTQCKLDIDFEIYDALRKLEKLRLVEMEGDAYRAVATDEALARLDEAWDGLFQFTRAKNSDA